MNTTGTLLHDVRDLVRNQFPAVRACGVPLARCEQQLRTSSDGSQAQATQLGLLSGVKVGQVRSEEALEFMQEPRCDGC